MQQPDLAIILVNLGTPAEATAPAIRRFLRQFLSDRRVVELPRLLWYPILYGIILPFRARRLAPEYAALVQQGELPLSRLSRTLQQGVQQRFDREPGKTVVELAMTYGEPSLDTVYRRLVEQQARRIVVLPLYPQYSATTTAAVIDQLAATTKSLRPIPSTAWVSHYWDHPDYIAALAQSVRRHWEANGQGDQLVMSFHGIPRRNVTLGDPYEAHCLGTAERLAAALELSPEQYACTFQSRLGRAEWLQPYTAEYVPSLPAKGVRRIDVISPAFATECLETLQELNRELREDFMAAGGEVFEYIPCLNDDAAHIELLYRVAGSA